MSVFPFNFLKCLNAVSICASNRQYYWQCHLFSGYESYVGHRGYCFVCWIIETYCPYNFEKIKDKTFIKIAAKLFKDIKWCYDFDKTLNFWDEEFEYKWREISLGQMDLKDCDYF